MKNKRYEDTEAIFTFLKKAADMDISRWVARDLLVVIMALYIDAGDGTRDRADFQGVKMSNIFDGEKFLEMNGTIIDNRHLETFKKLTLIGKDVSTGITAAELFDQIDFKKYRISTLSQDPVTREERFIAFPVSGRPTFKKLELTKYYLRLTKMDFNLTDFRELLLKNDRKPELILKALDLKDADKLKIIESYEKTVLAQRREL